MPTEKRSCGGEEKTQSPSPPFLLFPCGHWTFQGDTTASPMAVPAPSGTQLFCGPVQQAATGALRDLSDTQLGQSLHGLFSQGRADALLLAAVHLLAQLRPAHRSLGFAGQGMDAAHKDDTPPASASAAACSWKPKLMRWRFLLPSSQGKVARPPLSESLVALIQVDQT